MPNPARSTGVRPILGLITDPVKGPMGVCYPRIESEQLYRIWTWGVTPSRWTNPIESLFFQIPCCFYPQDQANIMDALETTES